MTIEAVYEDKRRITPEDYFEYVIANNNGIEEDIHNHGDLFKCEADMEYALIKEKDLFIESLSLYGSIDKHRELDALKRIAYCKCDELIHAKESEKERIREELLALGKAIKELEDKL